MNGKALVYGILVGGVIGSVTALLTAPLSGKELRNQMKETKGEWIKMAHELKEDVTDIKQSVAKASIEGKEVIKEIAADLKIAIEEWQKNTEPNKEALKEEMKEIQNTIAQLEQQLQKN